MGRPGAQTCWKTVNSGRNSDVSGSRGKLIGETRRNELVGGESEIIRTTERDEGEDLETRMRIGIREWERVCVSH